MFNLTRQKQYKNFITTNSPVSSSFIHWNYPLCPKPSFLMLLNYSFRDGNELPGMHLLTDWKPFSPVSSPHLSITFIYVFTFNSSLLKSQCRKPQVFSQLKVANQEVIPPLPSQPLALNPFFPARRSCHLNLYHSKQNNRHRKTQIFSAHFQILSHLGR